MDTTTFTPEAARLLNAGTRHDRHSLGVGARQCVQVHAYEARHPDLVHTAQVYDDLGVTPQMDFQILRSAQDPWRQATMLGTV